MFIKALGVSLLASSAIAFPWMDPRSPEFDPTKRVHNVGTAHEESRGLLDPLGLLTGVGGLLEGLLGSVATGVLGENKVPDAAHPFRAPGPTDQRGPCPGLNALANHGYISRNGIVSGGEVIEAVAKGFNMGPDIAVTLVVIAVSTGGNLATEVFSLGGEDDRTYSASGIGSKAFGRQYGLDGHSRCEGDISATRRDFFTNNGDNHNGYPDRFKRFIQLAKQNGGQFTVAAANKLWSQNAQDSVANNPKLYFNGVSVIVQLAEYPFIPAFFSNGTYGLGGVANYESISSLLGFKANSDGTICYVPERFPDNWYRRAIPYTTVDVLANLLPTYLAGPYIALPGPLGILQNPAQAGNLGCAVYQLIVSQVPASLLGETVDYIEEATKYVQRKLTPTFQPLFGCDPSQNSLQENGTGGGQYPITSSGPTNSYSLCA